MNEEKLRAWWWHRQGLDGTLKQASPTDVLEKTGWARSVGGAARSLGPEGKTKGLTTTLPLALGNLQAEGEIRRVPTDGRLDQQRYRYAAWRPSCPWDSSLSTRRTIA